MPKGPESDCYGIKVGRMVNRSAFYLFFGAKEGDMNMCNQAVADGADINFPFDGRKGTKGKTPQKEKKSRI